MERSIRQIVTGNSLDANHGRIRSHSSMLRGRTAWRIDPLAYPAAGLPCPMFGLVPSWLTFKPSHTLARP